MTNKLNVRIILKHDISENWDKINYIPAAGEMIVYDDAQNFKIGDGVTDLKDLPFMKIVPMIEGIPLNQNLTLAQLGIQPAGDYIPYPKEEGKKGQILLSDGKHGVKWGTLLPANQYTY